MRRYDFWAIIKDDERGKVSDRWRLQAGSFEEACEMAQQLQDDECVEYGYDQEVYIRYDLIEVSDVETFSKA